MGLVHIVVLSNLLAGTLSGRTASWPRPYPSDCIHRSLAAWLAWLDARLLSTKGGVAGMIGQHEAGVTISKTAAGSTAEGKELSEQSHAGQRPNQRMQSDAATRPQDRGDFETKNRLEGCTGLSWRRG